MRCNPPISTTLFHLRASGKGLGINGMGRRFSLWKAKTRFFAFQYRSVPGWDGEGNSGARLCGTGVASNRPMKARMDYLVATGGSPSRFLTKKWPQASLRASRLMGSAPISTRSSSLSLRNPQPRVGIGTRQRKTSGQHCPFRPRSLHGCPHRGGHPPRSPPDDLLRHIP